MSADAKIWQDEYGGWWGLCDWWEYDRKRQTHRFGLSELITEIEKDAGQTLAWEIRRYGDKDGLVGYRAK